MIAGNNSSLAEVVHVGKIIMIIFLTMSSCQRQVSNHKGDVEIIDVLNRNNLYKSICTILWIVSNMFH